VELSSILRQIQEGANTRGGFFYIVYEEGTYPETPDEIKNINLKLACDNLLLFNLRTYYTFSAG